MHEVSCKLLGVPVDALRARQIPLDDWLEGSGVSVAEVLDPSARIDWKDFAEIVERLDPLLGGTDALEAIGFAHIDTPSLRFMLRVFSGIADIQQIYFMGTRWFGSSLFGIIEASVRLEDGVIIETLKIPERYADCPSVFYIVKGVLRGAPAVLGLPEAQVELDVQPRCATLRITTPTSPPNFLTRMRRRIRLPFAMHEAMQELTDQQHRIGHSYRELQSAQDRIDQQGKRLAAIKRIGAELSQHIETEALARTLMDVLQRDIAPRGIYLSIQGTGNADPLVRTFGDREGEVTRRYSLGIAGRPLGELHAWLPEGSEEVRLLDDLAPWISIAVDNVRSYAALHDHNVALSASVSERTAELVKANEKLADEAAVRRLSDLELQRSAERLQRAERLASVGTLAAGIAHEINNPVASILAKAELAIACADDPNADEISRDALRSVVHEASRCAEIIRGVLRFSRQDPSEKLITDLRGPLVAALEELSAEALDQGVELRREVPGQALLCTIEPFGTQQAFLQVIRNAIDASHAGQHVDVKLEVDAGSAVLRVRDAGPGIDASIRSRIFDPFYTTRRQLGGNGLGLAVAHGVVAEHRGEIRCQDAPGGGTTFEVRLPLSTAEAS